MKVLLTREFSDAMGRQPKDVILVFVEAIDKLPKLTKHQILLLDTIVDFSSPEDKVKLYAYHISDKNYAVFTFTPKNELLLIDYVQLSGNNIVSIVFPKDSVLGPEVSVPSTPSHTRERNDECVMINFPHNIAESGLSIYHAIDPTNTSLYITTNSLERILSDALIGLPLGGYALRTRSKVVKSEICKALGYPIPSSFRKTQPRFPGQNFDVYTQKSLNVQIWNEPVDPSRRYVFLRVNDDDIITAVKVINGDQLARYDHTGTLTRKYQATMPSRDKDICSAKDSLTVDKWITNSSVSLHQTNPNHFPNRDQLLSIHEIYRRLQPLVGQTIDYLDAVQERNRGAELHAMICQHLGYSFYEDDGTYPDIANQLLEVKLQTSPTIDLGLHSPEDGEAIVTIENTTFYSADIRYAIFDGVVTGNRVLLKRLYLVTGEDFTNHFPLFKGRGTNSKIQLPLPNDFFD